MSNTEMVEKVWTEFSAAWYEQVDAEKASLREKAAALQAKLEACNAQLGDLIATEDAPREYLDQVAGALGDYATETVLSTTLREKFPVRRKRTPGAKSDEDTEALVLACLNAEPKPFAKLVEELGEADEAQIRAALTACVADGRAVKVGEKRGSKYARG